jgi:hypothetical protein
MQKMPPNTYDILCREPGHDKAATVQFLLTLCNAGRRSTAMAVSVASDTDQETTPRCPYVGMSPACWHRYIGTAVRVAMPRFSIVLYTKRCLHAGRPRRRWHKDCFPVGA